MMNHQPRAASHLTALSVILGFARPAPFQSFRHQGTQKFLAEEFDDRSTSQQGFPEYDKTDEIQNFSGR
jgi:hypothetical protein